MAPAVSLIPFFNVLAGMLHERLYSHMKDSLFPIIFENVQLMIQYHQEYASKSTTHRDPSIARERANIVNHYKQAMLRLSAIADILHRLEGDQEIPPEDERVIHQGVIELLQLESEALKTIDHLEEAIEADCEIESTSVKIMENMAKLRQARDDLQLLYLSKTVN